MWPVNAWKYDEINYYYTLALWKDAEVPIEKIDELVPEDYIKIKMVRGFL